MLVGAEQLHCLLDASQQHATWKPTSSSHATRGAPLNSKTPAVQHPARWGRQTVQACTRGRHTWMPDAVGQSPLSRAAHSCSSRCVTLSDTSLHRTAMAASSASWHSECRQAGEAGLVSAWLAEGGLASDQSSQRKGRSTSWPPTSSSDKWDGQSALPPAALCTDAITSPAAARAAPGRGKVSHGSM